MFDIIKKQNGETFAKAIRNYDNGIFDIPNLDKIVKYAGRTAEPILAYLVSLKEIHIEEMSVHQDPIDLLDKAGYKAWYVKNAEEQNAIAGYFRDQRCVEHGMTGGQPRSDKGEVICTIYTNWGYGAKRFNEYYIINAVKKEVIGDDKLPESEWHIKPANAGEEKREDEYGTSVISIQVLKSGGFISIKNRYNHTVQNPDNTFNSDPDSIIRGLSDAIKHRFNVDFSSQMTKIPNQYTLIGDQIFKYVAESEGIYFGVDSAYAKDGKIYNLDKNSELLIPEIESILNISQHKLIPLTDDAAKRYAEDSEDSEAKKIYECFNDKKIQIVANKQDNTKDIFVDGDLRLRLRDRDNKVCYFYLKDCGLLARDIKLKGDFESFDNMRLINVDISDANIVFKKDAEYFELERVTGLSGYLDFGNVQTLNLWVSDKDLSNVKGINFPKQYLEYHDHAIDADDITPKKMLALQKNFDLHHSIKNLKSEIKNEKDAQYETTANTNTVEGR